MKRRDEKKGQALRHSISRQWSLGSGLELVSTIDEENRTEIQVASDLELGLVCEFW